MINLYKHIPDSFIMGILGTPPPKQALLRGYWPLVSLDKAKIGGLFLGGVGIGGVP